MDIADVNVTWNIKINNIRNRSVQADVNRQTMRIKKCFEKQIIRANFKGTFMRPEILRKKRKINKRVRHWPKTRIQLFQSLYKLFFEENVSHR